MNCYKHLNDYAVATCASCGVGLCQNCLNSSVYSYDSKPLCHDCNLKAAEDEMSTLSRRKVWALIKCIFVLVFMILGFSIWQSTGDAMNAWIYAGIGGIPSAFKSTKSSGGMRVVSNDIIDSLSVSIPLSALILLSFFPTQIPMIPVNAKISSRNPAALFIMNCCFPLLFCLKRIPRLSFLY